MNNDLLKQALDALKRLLNSDPQGAIASATEDDLCHASNDSDADPVVREQAAAILQARSIVATIEAAQAQPAPHKYICPETEMLCSKCTTVCEVTTCK